MNQLTFLQFKHVSTEFPCRLFLIVPLVFSQGKKVARHFVLSVPIYRCLLQTENLKNGKKHQKKLS